MPHPNRPHDGPVGGRTEAGAPRRRRRRVLAVVSAGLAAVLVLTWAVGRAPTLRPTDAVMVADDSCATDTTTTAELAAVGGSGTIACESWDIGTGVSGYVWHAVQPRGVVLFQHGWGDHAQRWVDQADRFIPALLAAGFSVYGFDMWGSGHSPGARGVTDIRAAVDDSLAARSAVAAGPESDLPVFLVGHSIGGLVSATSALREQNGLAGVVLLAPGLLYDVPAALLAVARAGAFLAPAANVPGMANDEGVAGLTRDPAAAQAMAEDDLLYAGSMNFLTASTGGSLAGENWPLYGDWRVPVLAIHGTADASTVPQGSIDFIDAVGTDDATLTLIDGATHALLDDLDADAVRDEVATWLTDHLD